MDRELTKEEREAQKRIIPDRFCIHCIHKKRFKLNYGSQIYCEMQPSKRSNSGYQTIKAHDYACGLYKQKL
jgi:hypothetical protein